MQYRHQPAHGVEMRLPRGFRELEETMVGAGATFRVHDRMCDQVTQLVVAKAGKPYRWDVRPRMQPIKKHGFLDREPTTQNRRVNGAGMVANRRVDGEIYGHQPQTPYKQSEESVKAMEK